MKEDEHLTIAILGERLLYMFRQPQMMGKAFIFPLIKMFELCTSVVFGLFAQDIPLVMGEIGNYT